MIQATCFGRDFIASGYDVFFGDISWRKAFINQGDRYFST